MYQEHRHLPFLNYGYEFLLPVLLDVSWSILRERGWVGISLLCPSETRVSHIFVAENKTRHMGWILMIPLFLFH